MSQVHSATAELSRATDSLSEKGLSGQHSADTHHVVSSPQDTPVRERRTSIGSALARHESTADASSLASIDRPPSEPDVLPPAKIFHPFAPAVLALLMPASVFGTLARLGLQALATYDGRSIFPLALPQGVGCLIMGIALPLKDSIGGYYGPLYTAITTGFCGSLTTFSGWQLDVFDSWINEGQFHRNGLRDVVDAFTKIFFTLSISLASLSFGVHIGTLLVPFVPKRRPPPAIARHMVTVISILVYFATFPTYFRLSASFRHQATAALLFSFPGTLTRYVLSITLNPRLKLLPAGTLAANSFGTALLAMLHVLQGLPNAVSPNACSILQGLGDGYCGCLTTVSTFAAEVSALTVGKRWLYASVSIVIGQVLMVLIYGSSLWAGNVSAQATCAFT
ncbi:CrcB-like protein-domain-containing protein [Gloeopeniophorella convolvens]|nr:CrcB-like protein-domain-containing protein [Gloeopeniophorella convolvens]